jgi:exopolyphosphatase/guanosine-5'-triphosphate,3'-diphosphate pyrophosphatase
MRIAAIDIGTNSLHLIVCRVRPDLSFEVIDREQDMVRLGSGGLDGRQLAEPTMSAAIQTLSKFTRIAASHGADEIVAVATSAVREASNGAEFVAAVRRAVGIRVQVISGPEEARLIHRAAAYAAPLGRRAAIVVDIGGGSTEITAGTAQRVHAARSFKLGVIRLTERFVSTDPISKDDRRRLIRYVRREAGVYLAQLAKRRVERVIGTSGTILSLGALAAGRRPSEDVRNLRVSLKELSRLCERLTSLPLDERLRLPHMEPRRADLAPAGALLLHALLDGLGADEITLCDFALREGLVLDYVARNAQHIRTVDRYPDVRRRSVIELAERCHYVAPHARQVARLSLALFDGLKSRHRLGSREREWLEYGALLHDIGTHVSYERHHKHAYYLVKHGGLRGFEPNEVTIVGLIARYHRQATPKASHEGYGSLPKAHRRVVRLLGAIVRLAEGLDRSHAQVVSGVRVEVGDRSVTINLTPADDVALELWAAGRQGAALAEELDCEIRCQITGARKGASKPPPKDVTTDARHSRHSAHPARPTLRRRGHRRLGKDHPAESAGEVADGQRPPGVRHRMELVGARQGGHEDRQEEERADADDVQPAARNGLRGPAAL